MGRKIPGKKHRGVKDPEKQSAVRINSLKNKINRPPSNADEQPISKSLQKLINYKNRASDESLKVKKCRKSNKSLITSDPKPKPKKTKPVKRLNPEKAPANFTQLPGESSKAFMCRVNQTVKEYLKETQFENKFGVNITRDESTGEVLGVEKRPKDEFEELLKKARTKKGKKKKKKSKDDEPKLTKSQKRLKKITEKKEKKELARIDDFDKYKDEVKFGEIVHGPPTLDAPRKVSKTNVAPRPGQKELLLKSLTNTSQAVKMPVSKVTVFQKVAGESKQIDKKGKRRDLPNALRRQLEADQNEVMEAYRKLKAEKYETS